MLLCEPTKAVGDEGEKTIIKAFKVKIVSSQCWIWSPSSAKFVRCIKLLWNHLDFEQAQAGSREMLEVFLQINRGLVFSKEEGMLLKQLLERG
mmetsp:Transcript_11419/g.19289  ORF Transcript_11419/g.19289 Transcript_11419/m.19289 type:complete len:93 (-) Transcript_11419:68-346(-)